MSTPFITVNIDGPPTLHQQASVRDLLAASEAIREYALAMTAQPAGEQKSEQPPPQDE